MGYHRFVVDLDIEELDSAVDREKVALHLARIVHQLYGPDGWATDIAPVRGIQINDQTYLDAEDMMDPQSGMPQDIRDMLVRGQVIQAIKRYREIYLCGLAEAKQKVDEYRYKL